MRPGLSGGMLVILLAGCTPDAPAPAPEEASPLFVDVTDQTGIDFVHFNGMSGQLYFNEVVGAGAALFDYDNDGDLDLYLVQGRMLGPNRTLADAVFEPESPLSDRLYRNDLAVNENGRAVLRFTDITDTSGIRAEGYGMGVATGDYDGDGWVDLYVTNFGANQFWRNNGDGTFSDVTEATGTAGAHWSTSATFFDANRDGRLDLYVANYVKYLPDRPSPCRNQALNIRDYCGPRSMPGENDVFYLNMGDGSFENRTEAAGLGEATGSGLGVFAADVDDDGFADVYVANDQRPNHLWINIQGTHFEDRGMAAGAAVNIAGYAESSMGVVAGDFDGDLDLDLFMTHLATETNTLYVNAGNGMFLDTSAQSGLAESSLAYTGFGTLAIDYDNDGWLDILTVNGAVTIQAELYEKDVPFPLGQLNQLFHNRGDGRFEDASAAAGAAFRLLEVGRGAAAGDLDNDGDTDVVVTNNAGPARILLNTGPPDNGWLGLRLLVGQSDAIGARAVLHLGDGKKLMRRVHTDGSYVSASDPRILFGLGAARPTALEIRWADGTGVTMDVPEPGRYTTIHQTRP